MREGTPNRLLTIATVSSLKVVTKSLFRKILATSPYGSRFYADRLISNNGNSNGLRILERYTKKIVGGGRISEFRRTTNHWPSTRKCAS